MKFVIEVFRCETLRYGSRLITKVMLIGDPAKNHSEEAYLYRAVGVRIHLRDGVENDEYCNQLSVAYSAVIRH